MLRTIAPALTLGLLAAVPASAAETPTPLYSHDGAGGVEEFVFGVENFIGLRGSVSHPGGQTFKIRGYDANTPCPDKPAPTSSIPRPYWNDIGIGEPGPFTYPLAMTGVFNSYRTTRFCIYIFNGGNASTTPDSFLQQVVEFRDPIEDFQLTVPGTTEPTIPKATMAGRTDSLAAQTATFLEQSNACPAAPNGSKAVQANLTLTFPAPAKRVFSSIAVFKGGAGFWRACSYANLAAGPRLVSTSTFTITPAGGWDLRRDDLRKPRSTIKPKKSTVKLGTAGCPAACDIAITVKNKGKTIGKDTASLDSAGDVAISADLTKRGRSALADARDTGRKLPVTVTLKTDFGGAKDKTSARYKLR
ncbi:MAG: hypothetical protein U0R23_06535 [Candidatus Nanopelagicales bacterium]